MNFYSWFDKDFGFDIIVIATDDEIANDTIRGECHDYDLLCALAEKTGGDIDQCESYCIEYETLGEMNQGIIQEFINAGLTYNKNVKGIGWG